MLQLTPEGEYSRDLKATDELAYQEEINDFVACLNEGRIVSRVTPASGNGANRRQERSLIDLAGKYFDSNPTATP